jgi:hypothetical protein
LARGVDDDAAGAKGCPPVAVAVVAQGAVAFVAPVAIVPISFVPTAVAVVLTRALALSLGRAGLGVAAALNIAHGPPFGIFCFPLCKHGVPHKAAVQRGRFGVGLVLTDNGVVEVAQYVGAVNAVACSVLDHQRAGSRMSRSQRMSLAMFKSTLLHPLLFG